MSNDARDRFNLFLQPDLREQVRAAAKAADESMSAYIRKAVKMRLGIHPVDSPLLGGSSNSSEVLPACLRPPTS